MLPKVSTEYFTVANTDDAAIKWPEHSPGNEWLEHPSTEGADVIRIRALAGHELLAIPTPDRGNKTAVMSYLIQLAKTGVHEGDRVLFEALPGTYQLTLGRVVQTASEGKLDPTTAPSST